MVAMNSLAPYPWQQTAWQFLQKQRHQQRLPHALLFSGQAGIGKRHFACLTAQWMLCQQPVSALPCGECRSCQLYAAASHPDVLLIEPEAAYQSIKVDPIRQLSAFMATTAQRGGFKVVVLGPVEQLNVNAANALLKNLEEPTDNTLLLLLSTVLTKVMPTIRSRCQIMPLTTPGREQTHAWLRALGVEENTDALLDLSANAPLKAKALANNPALLDPLKAFLTHLAQGHKVSGDLSVVNTWLDIDVNDLLDWWLQLLILASTGSLMTHSSQAEDALSQCVLTLKQQLQALTQQPLHQQWLHRFIDRLLLLKKQLLSGANPNKQLLLEELLLDWGLLMQAAQKDAA